MKGHETTFLHTVQTPGSFFQWFHAPLIRYIEVRRGQIVTLFMRNRFEFHMTSRVVGRKVSTHKLTNVSTSLNFLTWTQARTRIRVHVHQTLVRPGLEKIWVCLTRILKYAELNFRIRFKSLQLNQTKDFIHTQSDLDRFWRFVPVCTDLTWWNWPKVQQKYELDFTQSTAILLVIQFPVTTPKSIGVPATIRYGGNFS